MIKSYTYWRSPKSKKTISFSLLLANCLIIASYAFFLHTHVLDDGTSVMHAHPFSQEQNSDDAPSNQKNSPQHEHTVFSYTLLSSLDNLFRQDNTDFFFQADKSLFISSQQHLAIPKSVQVFVSLRGPPAFC